MSIEYIDLFGGAGGWSCGLKEQGWSQRGFYEIEIAACATASKNLSGDISPCDLTEVDHKDIADVEFLIGSPPCQGFSNEGKKNVDDIRNTLVGTYLDILESKMPEVFVFENVPGFSRLYGGRYQKLLLERASELGYKVSYGILNLSDFGVPQYRKRFIAIGCRTKQIPLPVGEYLEEPGLFGKKKISIWEAISDLPIVSHGERLGIFPYDMPPANAYQHWSRSGADIVHNHTTQNHSKRVLEKIMSVPIGGDMRSLVGRYSENKVSYCGGYRRAVKDRPSYTAYWTRGMTSIHPEQHRFLSPRECARIQSFPDRFVFEGKTIEHYTQICNAVPPLFASAMARHLESETKAFRVAATAA